jgi:hypothetical protein
VEGFFSVVSQFGKKKVGTSFSNTEKNTAALAFIFLL